MFDCVFSLLSDRLIGLHDRRWLRDAHVDDVRGAGRLCRGDRFERGPQVEVEKLLRLRRGRVRDAQKLHDRVAGPDRMRERERESDGDRCIRCRLSPKQPRERTS
jgi:hypothetical protein